MSRPHREAPAAAKLPAGGRFCRVVYAPLTIRRRSLAANPLKEPAMRIYGTSGTPIVAPASSVRRTGPAGFAVPDAASAGEARAAVAPKPAANLDALLALQGIEEDPVERRKRSVQRGKGALDVLDDLKIGLLSGNFDASTVGRLRAAAANLKSTSGDPGLDAVLSEIELRVEVELAKAGQF
jgi:hypothetical protein